MSDARERLRELWLSRLPQHEQRLIAFAVPASGPDVRCDPQVLRTWLALALPGYMVPDRICVVDELPRTPSGKIDRGALCAPTEPYVTQRPALAPRNAIEARLATLFAQVLGVHPHSIEDDFFSELGGHSLLATQLASLIRHEWAIEFPLRVVFESPTVAGLAVYVENAGRADAGAIIPRQSREEAERT